ncbi:hypothetical protein [Lignipirellula cremea]|uniref:TPM domain-containing protein n=1 Tax=Lignipirellula cremea TaxID=2528010 RepID=A0A518E536_9BACT|nr:hypothetical protein [Lignipirellula cremea]QDU99202.1 hypothetical protein Pla8534_71150 [Lignipirellula cremea]
MKKYWKRCLQWGLPAALCLAPLGCQHGHGSFMRPLAPAPAPLGSVIDQINMTQETNAEMSKFVIYAHEFELNDNGVGSWKLNEYGQDHVKRIAANLNKGDDFLVIVERSQTSIKPGTVYELPVHFNEDLDRKRRQVIVASMIALGVPGAADRVVVAPAFAEGLNAGEAAAANARGSQGFGGGYGGFGGGFGGGGFGGGFN